MQVLTWIVYDIADDKIRNKIAKTCKRYGLVRVQKSVFLGKLAKNRFDELAEKCNEMIDSAVDSLYLFPFCQEDFRQIRVLGQGFDRKLVNNEILSQFF